MRYEEIIRKPLSVIFYGFPGIVVAGHDGRFFILHNNPSYKGDNAGPIKEEKGYLYSWTLGRWNSFDEYDHSYHNTQPGPDISEPDLSFKKLKRFSL
jgi:hypothetical protein